MNKIKAISKDVSADLTKNHNFIIGIGASAGGLEALEEFFRLCPADLGCAYVVIQHLDPDHDSMMSIILQRSTSMPVMEAADQISAEANHVYIIPPNRDLEIFNGKLLLSAPAESRGHRLPINRFFSSLADDLEQNSVGIILSGTGSDGTLGISAINSAGGLTIAQEPSTAKYAGMPDSAINESGVSQVLPISEMPEAIANIKNNKLSPVISKKLVDSINELLLKLFKVTGRDFSFYKKNTILRRINRRIAHLGLSDIKGYSIYIDKNPEELKLLFNELLINVTSFFRDPEAFAVLRATLLHQLKDDTHNRVFRAWVAGCATGEEAYSIAILLQDIHDQLKANFKVQIYATDLSADAISVARSGYYSDEALKDVESDVISNHFNKDVGGYKIKKKIRETIVFSTHNVIKDSPFTKMDLISCRNVMIYLESVLQETLIPTFHYALNSGGILFLSPAESIGHFNHLFSVADRKWKLYKSLPARLLIKDIVKIPSMLPNLHGLEIHEESPAISKSNFNEFSLRMLANHYAPSSVITNFKGDILYVHGDTGKYLSPAQGQSSLNVIEMAREGIQVALKSLISKIVSDDSPIRSSKVDFKSNNNPITVELSIKKLPENVNKQHELLLISFKEISREIKSDVDEESQMTSEFNELKVDMASVTESYKLITSEQQILVEELKSGNEELQSTNEELQSSNEELETSREELQSINEEMMAVNSELQNGLDYLTAMQNDMKNILESLSVGFIFLDNHLIIRNFTKETLRIYCLSMSDIGRPLTDVKSINNEADSLASIAKEVLASLMTYEGELHILNTWMQVRIKPYRTIDNYIDGVIITFTDITNRIKAIAEDDAIRFSEAIVNTIKEPLLILDASLTVISASESFYNQFKVTDSETKGVHIYELGDKQWDIPELHRLLDDVLQSNKSFNDFEIDREFPVIGFKKMRLNARKIKTKVSEPQLILLAIEVNA